MKAGKGDFEQFHTLQSNLRTLQIPASAPFVEQCSALCIQAEKGNFGYHSSALCRECAPHSAEIRLHASQRPYSHFVETTYHTLQSTHHANHKNTFRQLASRYLVTAQGTYCCNPENIIKRWSTSLKQLGNVDHKIKCNSRLQETDSLAESYVSLQMRPSFSSCS